MIKPQKQLSRLEWEIMDVIWKLGGKPSVRDVLRSAYPNGEKAYTTVQTVMNNLEQKRYLRKEKIGLVNFYQPLKKRKDMVNKETKNFVEKVFDGSFQALANHLVHSDSLTQNEINDLKRLIQERESEDIRRKGT